MPWTITLASLKRLNSLLRLHICFKVLLTGWSILTDTTENSFQSFGHGKHAKILVISLSVSSHQLQGVIKHLQNAACHSEQISKIRQSFFTFIDTKVLLHTENLAFVTVKKKKQNQNNRTTRAVNPWKALWPHSLTGLINMEIVKTFWLVKLAVSLIHFLAPASTDCWLGKPRGPLLTFLNRPMLISLSFPKSRTKSCLLKCLFNS